MAAWLMFAVLLIVALAPVTWVAAARRNPDREARRAGFSVVLLSGTIFALGLYWQPPLSALAAVDAAVRADPLAAPQQMDCNEINMVAPHVERASQGVISIGDRGEMRVDADKWQQLPVVQRRSLIALAARFRSCSQGGDDIVTIRDIANGAVLYSGSGPRE